MPSAEDPTVGIVSVAFQLHYIIENAHKNATFIDLTTIKLINSITDSHPADPKLLKTPEWAATKEGVQMQVSSFLDGVIGLLKTKNQQQNGEHSAKVVGDLSDEEADPDWEPGSDDDSSVGEEYDSEYDSENSNSDDEHDKLEKISEDEDEDVGAIPKKCLDTKLGEGIVLHEILGRKIARYGDKVVKSGRHLHLSEAEAMKFIAANTTIPVPFVHEAVTDGKLASITMDFVDGERLDKAWGKLPEEEKLSVAAQVNDMICQLRRLKGTYIGAIGNGRAIDSRRYDLEGGPFKSEAEFNAFLLSDAYPQVPKCFRVMAEHSLQSNHAIVFTHGDLAPRNILIKNAKVVAVLDWENSGWYPEYWEFVKAFNALDQRCNWYDYVNHVFQETYEQEFINDRFVGTLVKHGHS